MKKLISIAFLLALFSSINIEAQKKAPIKAKQLFGDISARQIGPALMSGRINDLENHPTNNRIIYAGTAGGGVWKSNDGGTTFNPIFDEYCQSIGAIEIDPNYAPAYRDRAIAKGKLKDHSGVVEDFTRAIEIDPNYATAYFNRGVCKFYLGDKMHIYGTYSVLFGGQFLLHVCEYVVQCFVPHVLIYQAIYY